MCPVEKVGTVSCQISYFPIASKNYIEEIDQVLDCIKKSSLEYKIEDLSTSIKGESSKVFELLRTIDQVMTNNDYHYTMSLLISNICGCELK